MKTKTDTAYKITDGNLSLAIWIQPKPSNAHRLEISKSTCVDGEWSSTTDLETFTEEELGRRADLREHGFRWLVANAGPKGS